MSVMDQVTDNSLAYENIRLNRVAVIGLLILLFSSTLVRADPACSTHTEIPSELYDVYLGVASDRRTLVQVASYGIGLADQAVPILDSPSDMKIKKLCDGRLVAVWLKETYGRTSEHLTGRVYDSKFQPLTPEFEISKLKSQWEHAVVPLKNGGFVVTWKSFGSSRDDVQIYARIFNASGKPIAKPIRVSIANGSNCRATAYGLPNGKFVVVWILSNGVRFRIFDEKGMARTKEVDVANTNDIYFAPPSDATYYGYVTQKGGINIFLPDDSTYIEKQPLALARSFDQDGNPLTEVLSGNEINDMEGYQLTTERYLRNTAIMMEHTLRRFRQKDVMGFMFCRPPDSYVNSAWANKLEKFSNDQQVREFSVRYNQAYGTECH